ncbi:MAG: dihydrodipicolinate synthase family protein [Armatimonadota bacterium]|nr:MAG: dihydrodipicolinate synthase family protein [Armatimonadota bacterium]
MQADKQPSPPAFLTGVITPMYTPRHEDGRLDLDGARSMVKWLKSRNCVSSVFARSGVGEMYAFTVEETRQFIDAVVDEAAGEIGVLAGCAGEFDGKPEHRPDAAVYTEQAAGLAQYAEERGASAAVLVLPSALRPEPGVPLEDTIFNYYKAVNDGIRIPIVIYQPPGMLPEYRMTPALIKRLLTLPRIGGMKLSTTDHAVFDPICCEVAATSFGMIAGAEHFYLNALEQGARGVIGGGCNTHPEMIYAVGEHFRAGRLDRARAAQKDVNETLEALNALKASGAVAGKLYIASKGYPMEPYQAKRRAVAAYGKEPTALPPPELVAEFAGIVDSRVAPYRSAIEEGRELP